MSLETQLNSLATRAGVEAKALRTLINGNAGDLSALTTTNKANLVAAVNELVTTIAALGTGVTINDTATNTSEVWSSQKVSDELTSQLSAAIDGAPAALDTLNELAAAIGDDANYAGTVNTALGNRVRHDAAQTLSVAAKEQACNNIGVGDPERNFVADFNAALV